MDKFNISTYIKIMQIGFADTQTATGQLLFGVFERSEVVTLKLSAEPAFISRLVNHKKDIPKELKLASTKPAVISEVKDYFAQAVVPHLSSQLINDTCQQLLSALANDPEVSKQKTEELEILKTNVPDFLAECFLYSLNRPNKHEEITKIDIDETDSSKFHYQNGLLQINGKSFVLDQNLEVPEELQDKELPYIRALLRAYADAEQCPEIKPEQLSDFPKKYVMNFNEQRENYYHAESVQRGVRDSFHQKNDGYLFSKLKDDLYYGISDVFYEDYENGFERLKSVLKQSLNISLNGSELTKIIGLIGNSHRKGICHLLVNDGRLIWVLQDETSV